MSAFVIYAIILTLAYIIYYSAMITREYYSKKGQPTDTTETFDVAPQDEPLASVMVNETKDSFYIGEEVALLDEIPEEYHAPLSDDAAAEQETEEPSEAEQHVAATEGKMDGIQAEYQDAMFAEDFACSLLSPDNSIPVVTFKDVRDEL